MHSRHGVTLIEVMIVVGVLGAIVMLSRVGVDFINGFVKQNSAIQSQREAQLVLYQIGREVRNCQRIEDMSYDKLVLHTYDLEGSLDTDDNPSIFNEINIGTITYQFVKEFKGRTYLQRSKEFGGAIEEEKKLLVNRLLTPSTTGYIFEPRPSKEEKKPWESLEVVFRMSHAHEKNPGAHVFRMEAMKRALTQ